MKKRCLMVLCQICLLSAPALAAPEGPVAVLDLGFEGEVSAPLQVLLKDRLARGLTASGMQVIHGEPVQRLPAARGCEDAACRRAVAGALTCRYVVGGAVTGDDRFFKLELWIADGYTGAILARSQQSCEICGQQAVGDKMDLSASALRAKLEALEKEMGQVSVTSDPPGAAVSVDGEPAGQAPLKLELAPGRHALRLEVEGHHPSTRTVEAVRGVQERVDIRLIKVSSPWRGRAGWILGGVGLAGLGTGIALFAMNGETSGCTSGLAGAECPSQSNTSAAAWTFTALGATSLIVGSYLLLTADKQESPPADSSQPARRAHLKLTPMGLSGTF